MVPYTEERKLKGVLRLGVSSCLTGVQVRWDGGHKHLTWLDGLAPMVELIPVCPEVAVELGVPRPPLHLVGHVSDPKSLGVGNPHHDVTDKLRDFGRRFAHEPLDLCGFILKSRSPSCGLERVKVFRLRGPGAPSLKGTGLFAAQLRSALPLLPLTEEGGLETPEGRAHFLERALTYRRWQDLQTAGMTLDVLLRFHQAHRLTVMAHGAGPQRRLERLLADAEKGDPIALAKSYIQHLMTLLGHPVSTRGHVRVMQHLSGYIIESLTLSEKSHLMRTLEAYNQARVPRRVPLTLLRQHFLHHSHPQVMEQVYLSAENLELLNWV